MKLSFNKLTLRHFLCRRIDKAGTLLCLLTAALPLAAQTAGGDSIIDRNITIEREYRPVIQDAGKINTLPHFAEPEVTKITPRYTTDFSKPLNVDRNIHYLSPAGLSYQRPANKEGYARVGLGTGFNSLADFAYPLLKKPDMKLDFRLNHYGLFNRKAHANTQAALAFDRQFNTLTLFAGAGGGHEYFKYYGEPFISNPLLPLPELPGRNHLWRANAHVGLRTSPANDDLRYGFTLNYDLFNSRDGVTEQGIQLDANINGLVGNNRFGFAVRSQNFLYSSATDATFDNIFLLLLNPYYCLKKEAFDLWVGFKANLLIGNGVDFMPSPDIRFEWHAAPRFVSLYAGIGGDTHVYTLSELYQENRFLQAGTQTGSTYTPADFYAGIKIKPVTGLLLDAFVDYSVIFGQHYYTQVGYYPPTSLRAQEPPRPTPQPDNFFNRFTLESENTSVFKVGGRISYTYHDIFNIGVSGAYNHWKRTYGTAWYKPAWELDVNANVRIIPKLHAHADMSFCGKRKAGIGSNVIVLAPIIDINLGASYDIFDWLSAFLKVNNLINNKYELWYGYEAQGFNVMAGATFSF